MKTKYYLMFAAAVVLSAATASLAQIAMKIGEAIYSAQAGSQGGAGDEGASEGASAKGGDDNVVDADFEEVKDDKRKHT